jgi:hypothetical protein
MASTTALGLAVLAGCGGGSSSTATDAPEPAAELTHAEWVTAADAVCQKDREANGGREEKFGDLIEHGLQTPAKRAAAASLLRAAVPAVEAEVASLGMLTPAASDQEAAAEVLAELKLTIKLNQQLAAGLDHGSTTELETLAEEVQQSAMALQGLARDLGLTVCGRPDEPE